MTTDRITNPLRLAKVLVGAVGAVISVGLAAPAGASPVTATPHSSDFLAAARAAGITGTDPAMLEDGYSVCRQTVGSADAGYSDSRGLGARPSTADPDEAGQFVLAAYHGLCPVPGGRMTTGLTAPAKRHLLTSTVTFRLRP